ncbi:transcription factor 20-like isoform X2 [Pecten maximus]|uniref:transcription factor 20-like isoform X2 n=1 Tax=Pecten maximus TaxID=6579 RepID=UPI0014584FDD|nr:transcription factor 20-like isoform X2 [Pecten maximus]
MPGPVERWLETFMCKQYADTFEAYGFKTLQSVCQLQHPQLQAMGVAQEHCEKILENVHVLRQTLYGQLNQNHYHEEMYPPGVGGRMPGGGAGPTGYQSQNSQPMPTMPQQNMANYQNQGAGNYDNRGQRVPSMHGQYSDGMYNRGHSQPSQHYMAQYGGLQGSGTVSQGPYGPGQYGQMSSGYGPMTGGRNYGSGSMPHSGRQQQQQQQQQQQNHQQAQTQPQQSGHVPSHMMHSGGQVQSPQDVANSILQMTAAYQPNQTVQVPLSKNRHAPYHVPNSPHYSMPSQGSSPTHQQQQQLQGPQGGHQFMYPSSSPHHSHPARTSPISPSPGYIHSPASHHSNQSLPNSSPRSIQSPTQHPGSTGGSVKSPVPPQSPIGSLKSPCAMQSPMNAGQSICSPTPVNQQLHVSVSSQNLMPTYTGQSPTQQKNLICYSPKTNPISPPASQISSPFTPLSKSSVQSPPQQDPYTSPHPTREYVSDGSQDPRDQGPATGGSNPLLSLQKLCMLPEKQVIDPKSVVNDACLPSPQSRDNSKNLDTNADSQGSGGQVSSQSDSRCGSALGSSQSSQCADGRHCNEAEESSAVATDEIKPPPCDNAGPGDSPTPEDKGPAPKDSDKDSFHSSDPIDDQQPNSPPPLIANSDMIGKAECSEEEENVKVNSHLKNMTCQQAIVNGNIQADLTSPCISQKSALTDEVLEEMKSQDIGEHLLKHRRSPNSVLSRARSLNCDVKLVYSDDCVLNGDDRIMDKLKLPNHTKNKVNNQANDAEDDMCIKLEKCGRICDKLDTSENASVESAKPSSAPSSPVVSAETELKQDSLDKNEKNTPEQTFEDMEDSKSDVISSLENGVTINKDKSENLSKSKLNSRRTQPERTMSLREVPARLANNAAYYNNYSDSDSNDDGILMVRKDTKATYSKLSRNSLLNGIQSPDILSSEDSSEEEEDDDDCKIEPDFGDSITDTKSDHEPWKSIHLSNDDTDGVGKSKDFPAKDNLTKSLPCDKISHNPGNNENKHVPVKDNTFKKLRKDKSRKLMEDYVDMVSEEEAVQSLDNVKKNIRAKSSGSVKMHSAGNKIKKTQASKNSPATVESSGSEVQMSKRKRRPRMSPLKYAGDMYYGGDYILDSDEEREVEVKSKRTRKPSGNPPEKNKPVKSVVVLDSDEELSEDTDKKIKQLSADCAKESTAVSITPHLVSSMPSCPSGASSNPHDTPVVKIEKITENIQANNSKTNYSVKKESPKPSFNVKKDNPEKNNDMFQNKPSTTKKRCRRPQGSRSSKGKLKKLEKSKCRGGYQNDEDIDDIQLKRTLALMKKKHRKKPTAHRESTVGPFIRLEGNIDNPTKCSVVNQLESDIQVDSKSSKHKKRSTAVAVSTVHISRLPTEKSVLVPGSSVIDETTWVCALCRKHSSYKFLGDLFGPYYTEGNLPLPKVQEGPQQDGSGTKSKKRKSSEDNTFCDGADKSKRSKFKKSDCGTSRVPREVWVHEDCLAWADGVLLIGQKVYGLEEATRIASSMVCSVCKESGAMVGCLHKGCSQKYHFYCAIETGCSLEEENFSLWCPKHKAH